MCYCGCEYENWHGECQKPHYLPCPDDEEAVAEYERLEDLHIEFLIDKEMENA